MQLMSIEDLAVYLGVAKRTIYKVSRDGDCPPYIKLSAKNICFDRADASMRGWSRKKSIPDRRRQDRRRERRQNMSTFLALIAPGVTEMLVMVLVLAVSAVVPILCGLLVRAETARERPGRTRNYAWKSANSR